MGGRRGSLPFEMGTRFPARLPLPGTRHARARRRYAAAADPLPDRDCETRGDRGHLRLLPVELWLRARLRRRRSAANEPLLRSTRDEPTAKASGCCRIISDRLPADDRSGAIVYCATRKTTERVAEFLRGAALEAGHFHAGLTPDTKREVQEHFRSGHFRVIAATSAFGMGIDKPDVRLVLHADIPGSLESYVQEAGRAGRDRGRLLACCSFATMTWSASSTSPSGPVSSAVR